MSQLCSKVTFLRAMALLTAAGAGLGLPARKAHACSYAVSLPAPTEATQLDTEQQPPVMLDATVQSIQRGGAPTRVVDAEGREFFIASSCSSLGVLRLSVAAEDNLTEASAMRYTVEVSRGTAPNPVSGVQLQQVRENELLFVWPELPQQGQEALDFELRLSAVDLAGNESSPFFLEVFDQGRLAVDAVDEDNVLTSLAAQSIEASPPAAEPTAAGQADRALGWTCSAAPPLAPNPAPEGGMLVASMTALLGLWRRKRRVASQVGD